MLIRLVGRILYAIISAFIFVIISSSITSQQCGFLPALEDASNRLPNADYPDWSEQQRRGREWLSEQERRVRDALRRRQEEERDRYGESSDLRRQQRQEWEKLNDSQRSDRRDYYRNGRYSRPGDPDRRDNPDPRQ